jgi:hypothetical protein
MKKLLYLTGFYVSLALLACGGLSYKAPVEKVSSMHKIVVIPMEPPPLMVDPLVSSNQLFVEGLRTSTTLTQIPDKSTQTPGRVGAIVFGILMLTQLPDAYTESVEVADSVEDILTREDVWIPTIILAEEAASQISSHTSHQVTVVKKYKRIPGLTERERTWHMWNWHKPIGDWYDQKVSPFDYTSYTNQDIDGVLEVGIIDYRIYPSYLRMILLLKLIDPANGDVIGRAYQDEYSRRMQLQYLLRNNAENLKAELVILGREAMLNGLKRIRLLRN